MSMEGTTELLTKEKLCGGQTDCHPKRHLEKHRKTCLNLSRIRSNSITKSLRSAGTLISPDKSGY